jgi:hypothetical protein
VPQECPLCRLHEECATENASAPPGCLTSQKIVVHVCIRAARIPKVIFKHRVRHKLCRDNCTDASCNVILSWRVALLLIIQIDAKHSVQKVGGPMGHCEKKSLGQNGYGGVFV